MLECRLSVQCSQKLCSDKGLPFPVASNNTSHFARAIAALILLSLIWGYNWVVMKITMPYIGPFQFGAIRTLFASLLLFAVVIMLKKPLKPSHVGVTAVLGVLQTTGFTGLIIWALVAGGAGKTAVLTFIMPFWVMLMAWPMLGEKIRGWQWLAVLFSVVGLLLVLQPWSMQGNMLSDILAISAGICWALAVILSKQLHQRAPEMELLSFTAWQMFLGSLPLVVLAFVVPAKPIEYSQTMIFGVLYNIFLANGLGWLLWVYALRNLNAGMASMNALLIPIIAVLAAWIQIGEVPSTLEAIGMLLIVMALGLITYLGVRRHQLVDAALGQD